MKVKVARFFFRAAPLLFLILLWSRPGAAQTQLQVRPPGFGVSSEIQGRIDFWKLIFTRYGEDHLVFHHREHPEIIYSVLDMSEFKQKFSGKELARQSNNAVNAEYRRIERQLEALADGVTPSTPGERRLLHLFSLLPGSTSRNLRDAAEEEAIRYQKGVRELFRDGLVRSGRYLHAMEFVFAQEGLPVELTRLPLVESSFNYNAYSSVGAAGIWQFMRATGKRFMRIDSIIDERKDPIMSTRAAARYLGEAYSKIGSWPLAVTSYNHGLSGVFRAVKATGSRDLGTIIRKYDGESFGFASKNFYAEFMAALEVEQNAKHYFPDLVREKPWHFDEVRIGRPLSYAELRSYAHSSSEEVENLNRALLSPITKGRVQIPAGTILRVPKGRGQLLAANTRGEEIPSEHSAATVLAMAKSGKPAGKQERKPSTVSAKTLPAGSSMAEIKVARAEKPEQAPILTADKGSSKQLGRSYKVVPGDTFGKIAAAHGVPVRSLLSSNPGVSPKKIRAGQLLSIPDTVLAKSAARAEGSDRQSDREESPKGSKRYTVRSGDTLSGIARKAGTSVKRLKQLNPRLPKVLKPGQELVVEG